MNLAEQKPSFESFFLHTAIPMAIVGPGNRVLESNLALEKLLELPPEEIQGKTVPEIIREEDLASWQCFQTAMRQSSSPTDDRKILVGLRNKGKLPVVLSATTFTTSVGDCFILVFEDRSEQARILERLDYVTFYDSLTGLANRVLLTDRLGHALAKARRAQRHVALLLLALHRFQAINNSLDPAGGDSLLISVAERLQSVVRKSDTVARYNGDKFAILLEDLADPSLVSLVIRKVFETLSQPFAIADQEIFLSFGMGVALHPHDAETTETLLKNAESALFRVKERGCNKYQFFTQGMNVRARERLRMESALHRALEREEFRLYFQPQVNTATCAVDGVEALLRWDHPDQGLISPLHFIPLLEETGLIVSVGAWVLRQACTQAVLWRENGLPTLRMAINISGRQFFENDFLANVRQVLNDTGLNPSALDLELTESLLMQETGDHINILGQLVAMGVNIAIDDFGTGYSSLTYLKRFPVHTLKIDHHFVKGLPHSEEDRAIAGAILTLADNLGLKVIVEGVENQSQLDFFHRSGCRHFQGYYFAKPIPAADFPTWLRTLPSLGSAEMGRPVGVGLEKNGSGIPSPGESPKGRV